MRAGAGKTADRRTRLSWRQNRGICCATEEYHPGRIRDREKKEAMEFGSRAQHPRPSRGLGHIAVVIAVVTKYADTIVADLGRRIGVSVAAAVSNCAASGFCYSDIRKSPDSRAIHAHYTRL